jgi:hypothetical protein
MYSSYPIYLHVFCKFSFSSTSVRFAQIVKNYVEVRRSGGLISPSRGEGDNVSPREQRAYSFEELILATYDQTLCIRWP